MDIKLKILKLVSVLQKTLFKYEFQGLSVEIKESGDILVSEWDESPHNGNISNYRTREATPSELDTIYKKLKQMFFDLREDQHRERLLKEIGIEE